MKDLINILRIESSARDEDSVSRQLTAKVIDHLGSKTAIRVTERNVSEGLPFVSSEWVGANFTPAEQRTQQQASALALSDQLIVEVKHADTLVLGIPVYNFGIPASLKAWIDQITRAGVTFQYTENGPKGLLSGKNAIVVIATGGTPVGSDYDYATPYIKHILGFIGITNVTVIAADSLMQNMHEKIDQAEQQIAQLQAA